MPSTFTAGIAIGLAFSGMGPSAVGAAFKSSACSLGLLATVAVGGVIPLKFCVGLYTSTLLQGYRSGFLLWSSKLTFTRMATSR